ncbi:MAG: hypothetical protein ABIR32_21530 [Ilumatobacteraceae bacterium]
MSEPANIDPQPAVDPLWGYVSAGESRWPSAIAVSAIMVLQVTLPDRLSLGPWWLAPLIEALLLFALVVVGPTHLNAESRDLRIVALAVLGVLIVSDGSSLGLLVHHLLQSNSNVSGRTLIYSAVAVWFTALVAFGLWFWEIDRGGPIKRCTPEHDRPDFLFPQMQSPGATVEPWTPRFTDYLYLSFTNSTAFSPTDTMPLTGRAKALMAAQSLASLTTIVVVGARAVNILN